MTIARLETVCVDTLISKISTRDRYMDNRKEWPKNNLNIRTTGPEECKRKAKVKNILTVKSC